MGARPDGAPGVLVCCSRPLRLLAFVFFLLCACLFTPMVATDGAASSTAAAMTTKRSPAWHSGGSSRTTAGADAFRSSKRRIPKGPDPIHNRRAGKTTIAPRRRD